MMLCVAEYLKDQLPRRFMNTQKRMREGIRLSVKFSPILKGSDHILFSILTITIFATKS